MGHERVCCGEGKEMSRRIFFVLFYCFNADAAVLEGYGNVQKCVYDQTSVGWVSCLLDSGILQPLGIEYVCAQETDSVVQEVTPAVDNHSVACYCRLLSPYLGGGYIKAYDFDEDAIVREEFRLDLCGTECWSRCNFLWIGYDCGMSLDDCMDEVESSFFYTNAELEEFLSKLFATEHLFEKVCEIGVSRLMTSVGYAFQLYAEKYTEPSLVVGYNDGKCYGKLKAGNASGTLNVNFNGAVYHLVD